MEVLVVGGTGFIGTALCTELHDRGHEVTALSRSPDGEGLPDGVETVAGDVTAYDSIEGAFEGKDAAVYLVALSPLFEPRGGLTHEKVHLGGARNTVQACEDHGVERLVHVSALGADPRGSTAYIRAKGRAESVVRNSGLEWVIFRPSIVFGDGGEFVEFTKKVTTPYVTGLPGGGKTRFQPIWVKDIAPMMADAVEGTSTSNRTEPGDAVEDEDRAGETYEVGGPEVLSLADVTRMVHRAEGKSVSILPVPMALAKLGGVVAGPVPFVPFGPDQVRSLRLDNTVADNDVSEFGRDPSDLRTLGSYLGLE